MPVVEMYLDMVCSQMSSTEILPSDTSLAISFTALAMSCLPPYAMARLNVWPSNPRVFSNA